MAAEPIVEALKRDVVEATALFFAPVRAVIRSIAESADRISHAEPTKATTDERAAETDYRR